MCFANFQNQTAGSKTALKSLVNQFTSSVTEMKLIPRQSPQSPPWFEMKSSQVILWDRSNSEEEQSVEFNIRSSKLFKICWTFQTKNRRASKEDVRNSNVLFVCIVVLALPLSWISIQIKSKHCKLGIPHFTNSAVSHFHFHYFYIQRPQC